MNLILINLIITYVWDIIGFPNTIASLVADWISGGRIKSVILKPPLGCSFCLIFWISIGYLLITGFPLLPAVAVSLLNAYASKISLYGFSITDKLIDKLFRLLDKHIDK
jgi:hypothetical protein